MFVVNRTHLKNVESASVATAFARKDFPVPGGPYRRKPLHALRFPVKNCGNLTGRMTASFSASFAEVRPATSSHLTSGFSVTMAPPAGGRADGWVGGDARRPQSGQRVMIAIRIDSVTWNGARSGKRHVSRRDTWARTERAAHLAHLVVLRAPLPDAALLSILRPRLDELRRRVRVRAPVRGGVVRVHELLELLRAFQVLRELGLDGLRFDGAREATTGRSR